MTEKKRVSEAYSQRPAPTEPWRFACPDCGSHQVSITNKSGRKKPGRQYSCRDHEQIKRDRKCRYRCEECQKRLLKVLDKANGELIQP